MVSKAKGPVMNDGRGHGRGHRDCCQEYGGTRIQRKRNERILTRTPSDKRRLFVLVYLLVFMLSAWGIATRQMRALKPSFNGYEEAIVAECQNTLSLFGEDTTKWRFVSNAGIVREFMLFGVPRGTVALMAHYTDKQGQEYTVTGKYHYRFRDGAWFPETVSGQDVVFGLRCAMQAKHPERALEIRRARLSTLAAW